MKRLLWCGVLWASSSLAAPKTVCVLEVVDPRGKTSVASHTQILETALRTRFTVIPSKRIAAVARAQRWPRSSWTTPPTLARLTKALGCAVPLRSTVSSLHREDSWAFRLLPLDVATGGELASAEVLTGKPKLSSERAEVAVEQLQLALQALEHKSQPTEAAPEVPESAPPEPAPAAPETGAWDVGGFEPVATESAAPSLPEALRLDTTIDLGGRVAFEHYSFFENRDASRLGGRDDIEASVRIKAVHPRATVFASLLARADFVDSSRNRFDPEEAWVDLTFPSLSIKVGRVIVSGGTATLYNPTDVLNHVDVRDPLDPEKVGALMVRATANLGPVTLEATYLPVPESHWFPSVTGVAADGTLQSTSRWVRGTVDVAGSVPVTYHLAPFKAQSPRPSNSQVAARAEVSVGGADIGVGYGYLIDHIPSALVEAVPAPGLPTSADVYVDWNYRRLQVITFDVERTFGRLRLAGEAAAFLTADLEAKNPRVADPYVVATVGGDFQTPEFLGNQQLHFFLEFAFARALVGKLTLEGLDSFRYPFPLSVLGRIAWQITDDLSFELNVFSSVERVDFLIAPRLEYQFFDRVKARLGADVLGGDPVRGFFGPFAGNSRFLGTVEAQF